MKKKKVDKYYKKGYGLERRRKKLKFNVALLVILILILYIPLIGSTYIIPNNNVNAGVHINYFENFITYIINIFDNSMITYIIDFLTKIIDLLIEMMKSSIWDLIILLLLYKNDKEKKKY